MTRLRLAVGERQGRLLPRAQMPRELENPVKKRILDALERHPYVFVWNNPSGATRRGGRMYRYGKKGSPDVLGLVETHNGLGRFLGLEVKRDDRSKPSEEQLQFAQFIRNRGGYYAVVWSVEMALAAVKEARG